MKNKSFILIVFLLTIFFSLNSFAYSECNPDSPYTTCYIQDEGNIQGAIIQTTGMWSWTFDGAKYISRDITVDCYGNELYLYDTSDTINCNIDGCSGAKWSTTKSDVTIDVNKYAPISPKFVCFDSYEPFGTWTWIATQWNYVYNPLRQECSSDSACGQTQECNDYNPYNTFCEDLVCLSGQVVIDHTCIDPEIPSYCTLAGVNDFNSCQVYLSQNIDLLEGTLDSKILAISNLEAEIDAKADIINRLTQNVETQSDIINKLTTDFEERQEYIVTLTSNLEEQGVLIKNLENSIEEKAEMIKNLNLNVQEQADMINQLTSNLQEKADIIKGLTSENEVQAELILLMEESFQAQSDIVQNLDLTIQEDAVIINNLDLTVDEQAQMINDFQLTVEQDTEIITELNLKLDEQEELIEKLGIENQNTIMNYIIMSGISAFVLIITVFIILRKRK